MKLPFFASFFPVLLLLAVTNTSHCIAEDTVEFLNGKTLKGTILSIRQSEKEFDFQAKFGTQTLKRTYPYSEVHAVVYKGKRFELTPMETTPSSGDSSGKSAVLSEAETQAIIDGVGKAPPSWLDSTSMKHPASLDLSWPIKSTGPWNESKNVGQYFWGKVYPNPSRWRSAFKLLYKCMDLHQSDQALLQRDMDKLGDMYFTLLQDYARAAYWLQKADPPNTRPTGIYLAECYWRLGNPTMARAKLRGNNVHFSAIKLYGDMADIDDALRVTELYARTNAFNEAFLNAGDALRGAGRTEEAIEFYQKVLTINKARNKEYLARYKARAAGAIEAIRLYDKADVSRVADGVYVDRSTGYNGKLDVEIKVAGGKITSAKVTKHREKQFYAALTDTTAQIVAKQGIKDIDGTSGATITSQAIVHATARALAQGQK